MSRKAKRNLLLAASIFALVAGTLIFVLNNEVFAETLSAQTQSSSDCTGGSGSGPCGGEDTCETNPSDPSCETCE